MWQQRGSWEAHRCDLVGLSAVFQQQGHDVGVTLLGRLVQRRKTHLDQERRGVSARASADASKRG